MAASFTQLIVVGNLGRDPEMRYTPSGTPVTTMSVAASRSYLKSDGEKVEETTWFRVTAWGKQAENCNQFLRKGNKVLVVGRLTPDAGGGPRIWTKTDGTPAASFEVNAHEIHFMSPKNGGGEEQVSMGAPEEQGDEIPF